MARVGVDLKHNGELDSVVYVVEGGRDTLDREHWTARRTGPFLVGPRQPKSAFLMRLCLSQGAGVSIILPTLPRKPWFCFPNDLGTQPPQLEGLSHSASECLKIYLHSAFPRSTE